MDKKMDKRTMMIWVACAAVLAVLLVFSMMPKQSSTGGGTGTGSGTGTGDGTGGGPDGGTGGMPNPASVYCEQRGGTLQIMETPAGQAGYCYIGASLCDEWAYFRSNGTECNPPTGAAAQGRTYCTPEQKRAQICTMEYHAVCGWYGPTVACEAYPCAGNFGNPCGACADEKVVYWTEGECPPTGSSPGSNGGALGGGPLRGGTGMANPASVYCEDQGGDLEIRDTPAGQTGYCHIGGKVCEEWAYFRSSGSDCVAP